MFPPCVSLKPSPYPRGERPGRQGAGAVPVEGGARNSSRLIRAKVYRLTGIPCSLCISLTKTLAKAAQRYTKKHPEAPGVLDLTDPADQTAVLEVTPVGDVWGAGPAYEKLLKGKGIDTARELRDADRRWVRQRMTVAGARIVEDLRGVSCIPLEKCPHGRKSVTCSRSFGVRGESLEELREAVAAYMTKAAVGLRRSRLAAYNSVKRRK